MTRPCVSLVLSALCVLGASTAALAQEPTPEQRRRGRLIIEEARALNERGSYALAAERWMDLYEELTVAGLPRASVALWNTGESLSHVPGREAEALERLRQFLAESEALVTSTGDERIQGFRSDAVGLIAELEARAPRDPDPGEELDEPAPQDAAAAPSNHVSPVGPIILGLGGATLLAAAIVGPVSIDMGDRFRASCGDLSMCPMSLEPQYDEMRALSTAADVLWVSGSLIAIAGLVLTLTLTESDAPTAAAACTEQGCMGTIRGAF